MSTDFPSFSFLQKWIDFAAFLTPERRGVRDLKGSPPGGKRQGAGLLSEGPRGPELTGGNAASPAPLRLQ